MGGGGVGVGVVHIPPAEALEAENAANAEIFAAMSSE